MQANVSDAGRKQYEEEKARIDLDFPFGIFWKFEDKHPAISRERLYNVSEAMGFRLWKNEIVQIQKPFIYNCTSRFYFDSLKFYIKDDDVDDYEDIVNAYETFVQASGEFTVSRLPLLDESSYVRDTRFLCQKFFQNGWLEISGEELKFKSYSDIEKLIFFNRVQNREYKNFDGGKYVEFLHNAIGITDNLQHILGYLSHEYKDETMAYIIALVEQVADPKDGGGSGKNVFSSMLGNTTTFVNKPGSQTKMDEKFFQTWNGQRLFCISDLPEHFDFSFLKEVTGGSLIWKKLWKDETVIEGEDTPKIVISTNYSFEITDGGVRRRVIPVEFTNFFTLVGGIDLHQWLDGSTGIHFPRGFNDNDWHGYDTFIAKSIQKWIANGCKIKAASLTETGWEKQFIHTYRQTAFDIIKRFFEEWSAGGFVSNEKLKEDTERFYNENMIEHKYRLSSQKINNALKTWSEKHGYVFDKDSTRRVGTLVSKGRSFAKIDDVPF